MLFTFSWKGRRRHLAQVPDARGAAAPGPARAARRASWRSSTRAASADDYQVTIKGDLCPFCRTCSTSGWPKYDGDWTAGAGGDQGLPPDPVRAGPHRHRHLPAQGREEPGLDRADRRHQLPQDRRVRHRQRPAGLQLRRRVEHRQPRPGRVHRGPQARRRVPLRPARGHRRSTRSSRRSSPRPTSTRSSSATPTSRNTAGCRTTSSWRPCATAR